MSEEKLIVSKDTQGNPVKVLVRKPNQQDYKESQIEYNKAWRIAFDSRAMLREQLTNSLIKEGIWSDDKQKEYERFASEINQREIVLKKGNIPLKKARTIALELKALRTLFRELLSEKVAYDAVTVEGQAENARFDAFVAYCTMNPDTKQRVFSSVADYNARASEPWAIEAATEIANMMYNIELNFEDKFLSKFKLVDSEGRLVNKSGHLITIDKDGNEKLINEKGEFVAIDENGNEYLVDYEGNKVEEVKEDEPVFLDDDGKPIVLDGEEISVETPVETEVEKPKKSKKKSE